MSKEPKLTAYCVKCKEKRPLNQPEVVTMKNGRKAARGPCPECGTGLYRILGNNQTIG